MLDVAPSELLIVAIVALVVIGPKDLPKAMRFVGKWVGKGKAMASHFRSGLDTMMRESELEDMEKQWRAHNDAIMRAYPDISTNPAIPPAPGQGTAPGQSAPATGAETGAPAAPPPAPAPLSAPATGAEEPGPAA
jgi:sec-independent protein translocase protein TatB